MIELKINIFTREVPYPHWYAELASLSEPDDPIHGNGDNPYEAIAALLESMEEHEVFRGDEE